MDDFSTRPLPLDRQTSVKARLRLAVSALAVALALSAAASPDVVEPEQTSTVESDLISNDITPIDAEPGKETLYLSARLASTMTNTVPDMHWIIRNAAGEILQDATAAEAAISVKPGTYKIDAINGETTRVETVSVPKGKSIEVGFVLNAGALRVLPRISNLSAAVNSTSTVFALSGIENGKLIAKSKTAGRIFNLPAGYYRVRTTYENSNVEAVADVRVKAGIMSAVNIDHHAGLAHLSYVGRRGDEIEWNVIDENGTVLPAMEGAEASYVLKPGIYRAKAIAGSNTELTQFQVISGEESSVVLGN